MSVSNNLYKSAMGFVTGSALVALGKKGLDLGSDLDFSGIKKFSYLTHHLIGDPVERIAALISTHTAPGLKNLKEIIFEKFEKREIGVQAYMEFNNVLSEGMADRYASLNFSLAGLIGVATGAVLCAYAAQKAYDAAKGYFRPQ